MAAIHPALLRLGFTDANAVRVALHLPPAPPRPEPPADTRYSNLFGDQHAVQQNITAGRTLMIGLALAGIRSPHVARIVGCSASAVKKRVRAAGIAQSVGTPLRAQP